MYDLSVYNAQFYELVEREGKLMAPWFVPLLREVFNFHSLADVGCGTGHYLRWCADHCPDVKLLGLEGSAWAVEHSMAPGTTLCRDLRSKLLLCGDQYDLATSIEVAEHIEEEFADTYVQTLCSLGRSILITAAPPGQGGTEHVNCQPPEYWIGKFFRQGCTLDHARTNQVKWLIAAARERGEYVTHWFEPNVLVFC